jgi:hypothetical protein
VGFGSIYRKSVFGGEPPSNAEKDYSASDWDGIPTVTCIDSTYDKDSNGGKLMSFNCISFDKPGHQGDSKYGHTYISLLSFQG